MLLSIRINKYASTEFFEFFKENSFIEKSVEQTQKSGKTQP